MKRILLILTAACFLTFSCTTDVDDVFNQTSSERLSASLEECKELLTSSPNGWLIEYFPSYTQSFGGYNFVAKFNTNGDVTMYTELASEFGMNISETVTSHYSLNSSSSVVLTFDTYNKFFHYFSDPDFTGGNDFGGEFEFALVSGDADKMIFRGLKTTNEVVFTALKSGETPASYLEKVAAVRSKVEGQAYCEYVWSNIAGQNVALSNDDKYNLLYYTPESGDGANTAIAYTYNDTGIRFYAPVTIGGVTAQYFDWDASRTAFASTDAIDVSGNTASITLSASRDPNYISYNDVVGGWRMLYYNESYYITVNFYRKVSGKTLRMTGIGADVEIQYNKFGRYISILSQPILGNYVYLCAWDADNGYLTWSTSVGMQFVYNPKSTSRELIARDNGAWNGTNTVNSFIIADLEPYVMGGSINVLSQIPYVTRFVK